MTRTASRVAAMTDGRDVGRCWEAWLKQRSGLESSPTGGVLSRVYSRRSYSGGSRHTHLMLDLHRLMRVESIVAERIRGASGAIPQMRPVVSPTAADACRMSHGYLKTFMEDGGNMGESKRLQRKRAAIENSWLLKHVQCSDTASS